VPSAYPQIWAWRNWLLIRPSTPTLACARFFHFLRRLPQRSRRRRAPTSEPIGRGGNTASGRGGSALASLGLARYKSRAPLTRRLPPCRSHTTDALVGAALRAVRIPTNMGVAQLASHSPLYPNSRMRPIFSFPAAPAAAVTPEACPYQRTHR